MADYQLTATDAAVIRTADQALIPNDEANRDWQEYQQWLADGGVPDPYVPPPQPEPGSIPPTLVASAHAAVSGGAITVGAGAFNIASATYQSKGVFDFAFINALPDANYTAMITSQGVAELTNPAPGGFTISVLNNVQAGTPHDPKSIDFQIYRVGGEGL
ncbi:hypothetical protein [Bradyrhizobium zhanjiangense]|nr:hypothetical protein [Bradyrhizobium zhanjiangense]